MKKSIIAALLMVAVTALAGCGAEAETYAEPSYEKTITVSSPSVSDVLEERTAAEASTEKSAEAVEAEGTQVVPLPDPEAEQEQVLSTVEGVDIDLTALSSTVVYAQVYNMMYYPEKFVGKTIRMEGIFTDYLDMAKGKHYFACFIQDATACCSQGVEFEPVETYAYPDDYPKEGDTVVVEGVFDVYHEDGYEYCTLRKAEMLSIEPGV